MTGVRVLGPLDPTTAWDGIRMVGDGDLCPGREVPAGLRGAAGWAAGDDAGRWRLLRDPLGIDKLFWARDPDGTIAVASRPIRLVAAGHRFDDIVAVPSGTVIDLLPDRPPVERSITPASWFAPQDGGDRSLEVIGAEIRASLTGYLAALAALGPSEVYVCLSGGLDSTGIAAMAREIFPDAIAVSFDLKRPGGSASDDRLAGERVARDLGMPMLDATVTEDDLLDRIDTVLVEGVDWRDFNVHAAMVNAALAETIAGAGAGATAIVLTGDLANEFLVDYEAESYRGGTYYRLPRLRPAQLRAWLVRGLDTCHREVGVFGASGLRLVQPYAAAVDGYLALPEEFLRRDDRKPALNRIVFGNLVPEHVYERKKTRAQVGSEETGGVLGTCLDRGIDQEWLRRRFATLHQIDDPSVLDRFMRAGRYRSGVPSLKGA